MRKLAVTRIRIITAIILLVAVLLVIKLYHVQIMKHDHYVARANKQYVHTVRDLYERGSIFFTTKNGEQVSAATVRSGFLLAVNPALIKDVDAVYTKLQPYLTIDKATFVERANLAERTYVEIETQLEEDVAKEITALNLDGVLLYKNQWRYYPGDDLSPRNIGFTGFATDGGEDSGLYGLERQYDAVLSRKSDGPSVNSFAEVFGDLSSALFTPDKEKDGHVVTTIEPTVSRFIQEQLRTTHKEWGSKLTAAIVMNPKTGEIIALEAVPNFNLNDRSQATIDDFKNPFVESVYEMGSIIKALTMAAGLDSGAVVPSTTYYDAGYIDLDGYTIKNYDGRGRGTVDMQEVLNQSLNTGVSFIVDTMGKDAFRKYFFDLKIDSETGIDLPNETYGLTSNLNSPRKVEYATASFGQGIAMTPIATVRALATLGNGGLLVTPHVAKKIIYEDGTEKIITRPEPERVFSEKTSETISRMLTAVVDDALAGGNRALPNHTVAAKTGTAQIAKPTGGYYDDRYLHSFFGYFPAYDPQFLVFLYTTEPVGAKYASETLTDPFMEITEFLINYYNIPPDR